MDFTNIRIINIIIESFPKMLLAGITKTIPLTFISFTIAFLVATILAIIQYANINILKQIVRFYIWIIRGTPLLVQLFIVFYGLPRIGIVLNSFVAAIIVFSINESAYTAETIRAALFAVPKGQLEAAYCIGETFTQAVRRIIMPQALKIAFPTLSNSVIAMVKSTSLVANITVAEMFMVTQRIVARTYEPLVLYIEVAIVYLIFSTLLTFLQSYLEKVFNKH